MVSPEAVAMISSANTAAIMATVIRAEQEQQQQTLSLPVTTEDAVPDSCDPLLMTLEGHLKQKLKKCDMQYDKDNIMIFNLNQVAYILEECSTENAKKLSRERVEKGLSEITFVKRKVPGCNIRELACFYFWKFCPECLLFFVTRKISGRSA